jgi:hypothetical protein
MTDQRAVPDADLDVRPVAADDFYADDFYADGGYNEWNDQWAGQWDREWDREWEWDSYPVPPAPQKVSPPWYRSPGLLLALIGAAAAVLVVATALLVGGRFGGDIPTSPQLNTRTATPSPSAAPQPPPAQRRTSTGPSTTESTTPSATAEPPPVVEQPAEPPPPPPAEPPAVERAPADSDGPRINVTRTPMSFSPGTSARP